jgi:hypothetical protein
MTLNSSKVIHSLEGYLRDSGSCSDLQKVAWKWTAIAKIFLVKRHHQCAHLGLELTQQAFASGSERIGAQNCA